MAQRVIILVGPANDQWADVQIIDYALTRGYRVQAKYVGEEEGGELRQFDPTPLSECTTLDTFSEREREVWQRLTLGDVQRMTALDAWLMFGRWKRAKLSKGYRHGTQFTQICRVMIARGLRFADSEPQLPYTARQWRREYDTDSRTISTLVGHQLHPQLLAGMDESTVRSHVMRGESLKPAIAALWKRCRDGN